MWVADGGCMKVEGYSIEEKAQFCYLHFANCLPSLSLAGVPSA